MKEIIVFSAKDYENAESTNYGDCTLINTGTELYIYDCGAERHAEKVIQYMDVNCFEKATLILSHNDSDHFDGIPVLVNSGRISAIWTTLLLKYVDEIFERIGDGRRNQDTIKKEILEKYDNIAALSGCNLHDIYEEEFNEADEISIVGPDFDYMLNTVAKHLDSREGDTMDGETAYNATSVQLSVGIGSHTLLLSGDASYAAIEDKVRDYDIIQLPHHGKACQADKIFAQKCDQIDTVYIVSDNTGNTNGGSNDLNTTGHRVYNTKDYGNICLNTSFFMRESTYTGRTLGAR